MRQINLLPSEIAQRRRARRITFLIAAGGMVLVALLILIFVIQAARLSGERGRLETAREQNTRLQRRITQLQSVAELQQTLENKQRLLGQLTANEVRWSLLLSNISLVIPSEVWLTNLSASVQAPTGGTAQRVAQGPLGTIQVSGRTFSHLDVARWLTRLAGVREFVFPYLTLSSKSTAEPGQTLVDFNSSVQLSEQALRRTQPGGQRAP